MTLWKVTHKTRVWVILELLRDDFAVSLFADGTMSIFDAEFLTSPELDELNVARAKFLKGEDL